MDDQDFYKSLAPLCVDLDGTLIFEDVIWVSWKNLIKKHPLSIFTPLLWLLKGRAYFKQELAKKSPIDPQLLAYNQPFVDFLKEYKKKGLPLVLATATDIRFAQSVADYLGIFDDIIASQGQKNLRAKNKALALSHKFGEKKFTYAGNSFDDIKVWKHTKYAIGVNLSHKAKNAIKDKDNYFIRVF
jgi:phosphoglycolate phosphatase-like HAD superfamily hydrolase